MTENLPHPPDPSPSTPEAQSQSPGLRVALLVMDRKRPGFDVEWAGRIEAAAREAVAQMGLDAFCPSAHCVDDASLKRALHEVRHAGCDVLVVMQPAMGDGRMAPLLAQLWTDPVVFWATPERPDVGKVSSCSLVGTHVFATIFRQLNRPFELAYGHPDDEAARRQLLNAVCLASAGAKLRRAKVGLVGNHAPGFINMQVDTAQLSRQLGVGMQHYSLPEFFNLVESQAPQAVEDDVAQVEAMGLPMEEGLGRDDLMANSRYYLAIRALLDAEPLDAMAVRCWPELPQRIGAWPYLAMARLAGENRPVALEGDVDGALSCLIGRLLGLGVGYITDWLEHDEHSITLWHPGHAPLAMCEPGSARLGRHFNNKLPLVVNATLAPDRPITLFRLWRCDGAYRMTALAAHTASPRRELLGANGLAQLPDRNVPALFEDLCHEGMPHHVTVLPGDAVNVLRSLARQAQVHWVEC
ncbi:MAG: sugar isomerase [Planctomycetes bacterium]|nr:sugar isomerase [Planctomycetota bacterium]